MFRNQMATITDTNTYQFSDTNDIINSLIGGAPTAVKNNAHILVILVLIGVLYGVVNHKETPDNVINVIDNPIVKISIMGVIILMSRTSPLSAIAAIIVFCLTIQSLQQRKKPSIIDVEEEEIDNQLDEIVADTIENDINASNVELDNNNLLINETVDAGQQNMNDIRQDINAGIDSLGENINAGMDSLSENINTDMDSLGENINTGMDSLGENINAAIGTDFNTIGSNISDAVDKVGSNLSEVSSSDITNTVNNAVNNIDVNQLGDLAQAQFSNFQNKVTDFKQNISDKIQNHSNNSNNSNNSANIVVEPFGSSDIDNFEKIN
tara:strand:+ start:223 stop:1194 length:972 start_codon:yes stop_codon:yes gene_type:complete